MLNRPLPHALLVGIHFSVVRHRKMPAVAKTTTMNKNSKTCLKGGHPIAGEGVMGWMEGIHIEIARASTQSEITNTNNDRK